MELKSDLELRDLFKIREFINHSSAFSEKEQAVINKICAKEIKKIYDDLCKKYNLCPVCGERIKSNGTMTVGDSGCLNPRRYAVKVSVCPNSDCEYNKQLAEEMQKEFEIFQIGSISSNTTRFREVMGNLFYDED